MKPNYIASAELNTRAASLARQALRDQNSVLLSRDRERIAEDYMKRERHGRSDRHFI
jgi:hypothetical protein